MKELQSVTTILNQIFPYDNRFFLKSLSKEGIKNKKIRGEIVKGSVADKAGYINYEQLMDTLTSFGSIIHLYAYTYGAGLTTLILPENYQPYINGLNDFFRRYKARTILGEHFVTCSEYSGTFDGLLELTLPGTSKPINVLVDFKTWKYYKDFYGIENRILRKSGEPYWDEGSLKKVGVQASMYKYAYEQSELSKQYPVDALAVVRVTRRGTFFKLLDDDISLYLEWKNSPENGGEQKQIGRI